MSVFFLFMFTIFLPIPFVQMSHFASVYNGTAIVEFTDISEIVILTDNVVLLITVVQYVMWAFLILNIILILIEYMRSRSFTHQRDMGIHEGERIIDTGDLFR